MDLEAASDTGAADWSWVPGAAIAAMALAFTIGSFWWLQAQQGKLRSYEPQSFAFQGTPERMLLRFPLVLFNTGAKPIVVRDLRLSFPEEPGAIQRLRWWSTRSQVEPARDDGKRLPAVFAVPGRQAQQHFIEFGAQPFPRIVLQAHDYHVSVQALVGHRDDWQPLISFTLRAGHITAPLSYLAHSNASFDLTPDMTAQTDRALKRLMEMVEVARTAPNGKPQDDSTA